MFCVINASNFILEVYMSQKNNQAEQLKDVSSQEKTAPVHKNAILLDNGCVVEAQVLTETEKKEIDQINNAVTTRLEKDLSRHQMYKTAGNMVSYGALGVVAAASLVCGVNGYLKNDQLPMYAGLASTVAGVFLMGRRYNNMARQEFFAVQNAVYDSVDQFKDQNLSKAACDYIQKLNRAVLFDVNDKAEVERGRLRTMNASLGTSALVAGGSFVFASNYALPITAGTATFGVANIVFQDVKNARKIVSATLQMRKNLGVVMPQQFRARERDA